MKSFPRLRLILVLGLLGSGAYAGVVGTGFALADPSFPGRSVGAWNATPSQHRDWVQAQRAWADEAYHQTMWRLDQLERCLVSARQRRDQDQCLRRDAQARERQWQRDQQEWQVRVRRQAIAAQLSWQPGLGF